MANTKTNGTARALRIGLGATLVAAAALAFSGDALAHGKHKHGKHHGRHAPVVVVPAPVAPPVVLRDVRAYAPYRAATVWYAPHRHRHVVYRFPVATRYGVVYEPYAYCDGHRYGVVTGPVVYDRRPHGYVSFGDEHVRIGIGF